MEEIQISIKKGKRYKRYLSVQMLIPYSIEQVWQVITSYDTLTEFIPNLVKSRRLQDSGSKFQLELVGACQILNFPFSVRTVLEVTEHFPDRIDTQMIEGDLNFYCGQWRLEKVDRQQDRTLLSYSAEIVPKFSMPIALLERQIHRLLPVNFLAIRHRLDTLYPANSQVNSFN